MSTGKYGALGVSASKAGLHQVLEAAGVGTSQGLFAAVTEDVAGDPRYCSFIHCDGAGTKSIVPYLFLRETGSYELFKGLAQDALVMNLDDIYCIGAPERLILANAVARNARLIDDKVLSELVTSYKSLCEQLSALGVPLQMSGGETADCGDVVRTLVVDAVITGRIRKDQLITADNIVPGDVIVGVSSTGKAGYEPAVNSGIGSNGLTLARHSLLSHSYAERFPEVLDPGLDPAHAYRGPFLVTDAPAELGMSIGHALSSPTRTYTPLLAKLYQSLAGKIHGVIHVTGGGQTKVLRFGRGNRYVKDNLFPVPPLLALIQQHGQVSWREMYQVFNMGHRLELYLERSMVDETLAACTQLGLDAKVIGRVEAQSGGAANSVRLETPYGDFEYSLDA